MKKTFVKALASLLVILTLISSVSIAGMALEPMETEMESVSAMMDNSYCFNKKDNDTVVDEGTMTDAEIDYGTATDAVEEETTEKVGFFARIWRFIWNTITFKWLFK